MKAIDLEERRKQRTMRIMVTMPAHDTVGFCMYEGDRHPDQVWEDDEGLHVVVLASNQAEAMVDGVEKIRVYEEQMSAK